MDSIGGQVQFGWPKTEEYRKMKTGTDPGIKERGVRDTGERLRIYRTTRRLYGGSPDSTQVELDLCRHPRMETMMVTRLRHKKWLDEQEWSRESACDNHKSAEHDSEALRKGYIDPLEVKVGNMEVWRNNLCPCCKMHERTVQDDNGSASPCLGLFGCSGRCRKFRYLVVVSGSARGCQAFITRRQLAQDCLAHARKH